MCILRASEHCSALDGAGQRWAHPLVCVGSLHVTERSGRAAARGRIQGLTPAAAAEITPQPTCHGTDMRQLCKGFVTCHQREERLHSLHGPISPSGPVHGEEMPCSSKHHVFLPSPS